MLKRYFLLIITCLPFLAFAQKRFTIKGDVKSFKDGEKIFLSYKENGTQHYDSTVVANGVFLFTGTVLSLGEGYLSRNDNPLYAAILHDTGTIFIQPGDITINTADSLVHATITGTQLNSENTELKISLMTLSDKLRKVTNAFDALTPAQQADASLANPLAITSDSLYRLMEPAKLSFIKSHPNSYVSLITLDRMVNHAQFMLVADAYDALSDENKNTDLGKKIAKVINAAKRSQIGAIATDFTLPTSTNKTVSLSDYRGKYVLVDFWASWCIPCRNENPNVRAAYQKFKAMNFTILSISIDNSKTAWLKAIAKDKLGWTQVIDNAKAKQSVNTMYGVTSIPANVLVDPEGKIVAKNIKGDELHTTLAKFLAR